VCCSVLQCVAVCCSVLQCVAVCCSALQCASGRCSALQYVAVRCSVLQGGGGTYHVPITATHYTTLQHAALTLQHTATHCNTHTYHVGCQGIGARRSLAPSRSPSLFLCLCVWGGCLCACVHIEVKCVALPHKAVYCSVLQCVAVCCSVLQCVVVCCSVLQCVAVCCSML